MQAIVTNCIVTMYKGNKNYQEYAPVDTWIQLGEQKRLGIRQTYHKGILYLDVRIWLKKHAEDEFFPTRKGICLSAQTWKEQAIPAIQALF